MPGRIPDRYIDDLLARVDIVDVIDGHVPLRKQGKDYKACCPFHEEKTPSFTVSPDKQFYHCFGCGAHGSAIGFLMQYERMTFPEAVKHLANRVGLPLPEADFTPAPAEAHAPLLDALEQAHRYYQRQWREHPQAQQAKDYLRGRGVSGEIAKSFGLGFAPEGWDSLAQGLGADAALQETLFQAGLLAKKETGRYYDRFRHRVMFPIHDYRGRLIGFGGRIVGSGEPKYLNSPETPLFHKGRELYGLFRARDAIKRENRVVVVEGYMDVVALAQFGIDYAVATLGTATTRDHLERLFRFTPEIVFCFDGDRAGREAAWRALENALPVASDGRQIGFLFLPEGEDPDTLVRKEGPEGFKGRLNAVISLPDFLFQSLGARVDLGRLDGRAKLVELARPLLSKLPLGALRELMMARLAELSRLDDKKLSTLIVEPKTEPRPMPHRRSRSLGAPSLVRTAIAALLTKPALAREVADPQGFADLDLPGASLLVNLLELLKTEIHLTTGAILERYRDTEYHDSLAKLASWDHPALSQDISAEFHGLMERLKEQADKQAAERLIRKSDLQGGLDAIEQAELQRLLGRRVKLTV